MLTTNQLQGLYDFNSKIQKMEAFNDESPAENHEELEKLNEKKTVKKRSKNHFSKLKSFCGVRLGEHNYDRRELTRVITFICMLFSFVKAWNQHSLIVRIKDKSLSDEEQYEQLKWLMKRLESVMRNLVFQIYFPAALFREIPIEELCKSKEYKLKDRTDPISVFGKIEFSCSPHLHLHFFTIFKENPNWFVKLIKFVGGDKFTVCVQTTPADQRRMASGTYNSKKGFEDVLRSLAYNCKEDNREQLDGNNRLMFIHSGNLKKALKESGKEIKSLEELVLDSEEVEAKKEQAEMKIIHNDFFGIQECKLLRYSNIGKFGKPKKAERLIEDDELRDDPIVELKAIIKKSIELLPGMFRNLFVRMLKNPILKVSSWWTETWKICLEDRTSRVFTY